MDKEKEKMTRGKKLLLLLAIFAVVAVLAFAVTKMEFNSEESSETAISLPLTASDKITEISWTYGDVSYDLKKSESGWINANDESVVVNSTYLDEIFEQIDNMTASKVIEGDEASDLSQFGFDSPECTIKLICGEETTELLFGAENQIGGLIYVSVGDGKVYLVDSEVLTSFECEQSDIFETGDETDEATDSGTDAESE